MVNATLGYLAPGELLYIATDEAHGDFFDPFRERYGTVCTPLLYRPAFFVLCVFFLVKRNSRPFGRLQLPCSQL